jgi:hypothetical protein
MPDLGALISVRESVHYAAPGLQVPPASTSHTSVFLFGGGSPGSLVTRSGCRVPAACVRHGGRAPM